MDPKWIYFPIVSDGNAIRATGAGMSFIMHASIGGSMDPASRGMDGGWQGLELEFVNLSWCKWNCWQEDIYRWTGVEYANVGTFTDGYAVTKYINVNADGSAAQRNDIPDIDFPMFRLTDVYLMYAEATLRGATMVIQQRLWVYK
jgi:hypothetical protein